MPDITKCENDQCPLSWNCWRYNAPPNPIKQPYDNFSPDKDGNCKMYIAMDEPIVNKKPKSNEK